MQYTTGFNNGVAKMLSGAVYSPQQAMVYVYPSKKQPFRLLFT
jgi:hypothetical protein